MWDNSWYQHQVNTAWTYMDIFTAANGKSLDFYFVIFIHNGIVQVLAMKKTDISMQHYPPSFRYLKWKLTGKIKMRLCEIPLLLTSENGKIILQRPKEMVITLAKDPLTFP